MLEKIVGIDLLNSGGLAMQYSTPSKLASLFALPTARDAIRQASLRDIMRIIVSHLR